MHLAAVAAAQEMELSAITQTDVPLRKWNNIVIHTSVEGQTTVDSCHLVVDLPEAGDVTNPLNVRSNKAWLQQMPSRHVGGKGNEWSNGSIGICVMGDFSKDRPSELQMQALVKLVNDLQKRFNIPAARVHLYRNISGRATSPGDAFPEKEFSDALQ